MFDEKREAVRQDLARDADALPHVVEAADAEEHLTDHDVDRIDAEEGWVTVLLHPQEYHYNPLGTVHGGILSTLLDTAAACAVHSTLPAGVGYTSLDLNVKFLRPVTLDSGQLRCEGVVLQRGRRTAYAEARLTDAAGRLAAHATSSCLLFDIA